MIAIRLIALAALLLASPAFAEGWRVMSVSGDVVSVNGADPDPLEVGSVVNEGATVVSGPSSSVLLSRRGDIVSLGGDTMIALRPGSGGARATVETRSGDVEITSVANAEGPFDVKTHFFSATAQAADFTVTTRKDFATIDVNSGDVQVTDPRHGGALVDLAAGDSFRGSSKATDDKKDGKTKAPGNEADGASKKPDEGVMKKSKHAGKHSDIAEKLVKRGGGMAKEGLEDLADEYDGDEVAPETPKIGILTFLFGPSAPSATIVLIAIGVVFTGFGYLTSSVLGSVGFGTFGNGAVLLVGALLGAGIHDLTFSPAFFWEYEPTPGIFTTVIGAFAGLIGACFARKQIQERMDEAASVEFAKTTAAAQARLKPRRG